MKPRLALLLVLAVVWLIPFFWAGWMGRLPVKVYSRLSFQYTAAGLFTLRTGTWTQMLIQIQQIGSAEWKTIDTAELSPMGAFGYRQRLDRILQETHGRPVGDDVRQRLAGWVAKKYEEHHPSAEKVTGVRFGQTAWAAGSPELAHPIGHWVPDPPTGRPLLPFKSLSAYEIHDGEAGLILPSPLATRPKTPVRKQQSTPIRDQLKPVGPRPAQGATTQSP